MKKLLLIMISPVLLFGQFEDNYYVVTDEVSLTHLKEFNLGTNTIENEYQLFIENEPGSGTYYDFYGGNVLTYQPNSSDLFIQQIDIGFKQIMDSYTSFFIFKNTPPAINCNFVGQIAGISTEGGVGAGSISLGFVHGIDNTIYYLADIYGSLSSYESTKLLSVDFEEEISTTLMDISELGGMDAFKGIAYNPESNTLYLYKSNESGKTLYSFSIESNTITPIPINFHSDFWFGAMHYMRGQNKLMIVDYETGDFYVCDLTTNQFSLYAESHLEYVTGIVNVRDFLGNYEVENQGEVNIYPNPVKDNINIETNSQIEKIELYNIVGQRVNVFKKNSKTINISNQPKGIYVLKIILKNGKTETKKIIKE